MVKEVDVILSPEEAADSARILKKLAEKSGINSKRIGEYRFLRRAIDARRRDVKIDARIAFAVGEPLPLAYSPVSFIPSDSSRSVVVVGSGPAGLFAALTLLENGLRPIVLERGKDVHERKKDTALLSVKGILDPDSNYCYGEGGAGAFSDGKLYTRSVKRGDVKKVLSLFVQHGADPAILYETHPHLGTDRLPTIIENIRRTIESYGGEVHFKTKVTSLLMNNGSVCGVRCESGEEFLGPVIIATGHSAKDVYYFLSSAGVALSAKDTAIGVRLEHPQALIDRMQYHSEAGRGLYLPPASYSFVTQALGRGVYSFCMCPGGSVVPAATEAGHQVVNGMSSSSRGGEKANSAMVVELRVSDLNYSDPFAMLRYIEEVEASSYREGFVAPAQRLTDFIDNRVSSTLPLTTYKRGLEGARMDEVLPSIIINSLREGLKTFGRKSGGQFITDEAVLIATETRTSSPVKILRNEDTSALGNLFVAGEGAGYAGGIVSAALDGIKAALSVVGMYNNE